MGADTDDLGTSALACERISRARRLAVVSRKYPGMPVASAVDGSTIFGMGVLDTIESLRLERSPSTALYSFAGLDD